MAKKGMDNDEKAGIKDLLGRLNDGELGELKYTVTKKQVKDCGRKECVDNIVAYSESAYELLHRKKLKQDILFQYLADHYVDVPGKRSRETLIDSIIKFWKSKSNEEKEQNSGMEGEVSCKVCSKQYKEKHTRMMKCDRCHGHFCIGCLDFDTRKHEILSESDSMWFCPPCRVTVEKSILTDRKIEERCREIMEEYEGRIAELERLIKLK